MRKPLLTAISALGIAGAIPMAAAAGPGFDANWTGAHTSPIGAIEVSFGERLMRESDELGGEREFPILEQELREDLVRELSKAGQFVESDGTGYSVLRVTIVDADPSRPTIEQVGDGIDPIRSIFRGGADLEADLVDASGNTVGRFSYSWEEPFLGEAQAKMTWTDANRAFSRFATRLARNLSDKHSGS